MKYTAEIFFKCVLLWCAAVAVLSLFTSPAQASNFSEENGELILRTTRYVDAEAISKDAAETLFMVKTQYSILEYLNLVYLALGDRLTSVKPRIIKFGAKQVSEFHNPEPTPIFIQKPKRDDNDFWVYEGKYEVTIQLGKGDRFLSNQMIGIRARELIHQDARMIYKIRELNKGSTYLPFSVGLTIDDLGKGWSLKVNQDGFKFDTPDFEGVSGISKYEQSDFLMRLVRSLINKATIQGPSTQTMMTLLLPKDQEIEVHKLITDIVVERTSLFIQYLAASNSDGIETKKILRAWINNKKPCYANLAWGSGQ